MGADQTGGRPSHGSFPTVGDPIEEEAEAGGLAMGGKEMDWRPSRREEMEAEGF